MILCQLTTVSRVSRLSYDGSVDFYGDDKFRKFLLRRDCGTEGHATREKFRSKEDLSRPELAVVGLLQLQGYDGGNVCVLLALLFPRECLTPHPDCGIEGHARPVNQQ